jgi:hypothetical protein
VVSPGKLLDFDWNSLDESAAKFQLELLPFKNKE